MLWKVREGLFLTNGILCTIMGMLIDSINPFSPRIDLDQLYDAKIMSKYIQLDVIKVEDNSGYKVGAGAGGTGTCRRALIVHLKGGEVLYLFVKVPTTSFMERAFMTVFQVYNNEMHFYEHVSALTNDPHDSWQICPKVYFAKRFGTGKFLLIQEDIRFRPGGCVFKTTLEIPFSTVGAKIVLTELSRLHTTFWRNPPAGIWRYSSKTGLSLGSTPPLLRILAEASMKQVKKRYGEKITLYPDVEKAFELMVTQYTKLRKYWSRGPLTIAHGDCHMGNVFVNNGLTRGGFVDYQCVSEELCMRDVSYHLINSCPADFLPQIEEEMINHYLSELKISMTSKGKEMYIDEIPNYEQAYFMYRTYGLWCLMAWVICCGFSDVVMESFAVSSLQRTLDTCHRLKVFEAMQKVIEIDQKEA